MMYPLKFVPYLLSKVWGGQSMANWYPDQTHGIENIGESWVISGYDRHLSIVANGHLAGDELTDLIEVYADELVGEKVYEQFGSLFPLLFKFIDANDDLSIQVHPNDEQANQLEESLGKEEMWYVMPSKQDAKIYVGWNQPMSPATVKEAIQNATVTQYLKQERVEEGDVALITPGTVHALLKGTMVAEIQESSDITYRLYDYNRPGMDGQLRPLHVDKAIKVLGWEPLSKSVSHSSNSYGVENIAKTNHFTTNILHFNQPIKRDYAPLDSFVVYMCVAGSVEITATEVEDEAERTIQLNVGEAALIPACLNDIEFLPLTKEGFRLLEVYIE